MKDLAGKRALVIGGAGGLVLALSSGLASAGARVDVAGRSQEKLAKALKQLRDQSPDSESFEADVIQVEAIQSLAQKVDQEGPPLDILVNCQGTTIISPALEIEEAGYDSIMATNAKSVFFCSTILGSQMLKRRTGTIVNICSLAAHRGWPNAAVYAMSKHAILGLTRSLAAEWAPHGVRVNSISPGFFMTDLNRDRMGDERKAHALQRTPNGRFGEPDELQGALLYLAGDSSGFVTGTDISVDGGYLASGI